MIMTFLWFSDYVTCLLFNSQRWLMHCVSLLLHFGFAFFFKKLTSLLNDK